MTNDSTEQRLIVAAANAADEAVGIIQKTPFGQQRAVAIALLAEFKEITRSFEIDLIGVVSAQRLARWTLAARETFFNRCAVWLLPAEGSG